MGARLSICRCDTGHRATGFNGVLPQQRLAQLYIATSMAFPSRGCDFVDEFMDGYRLRFLGLVISDIAFA